MDVAYGGLGNLRFLVGVDQRLVVDRRVGLVFIQHYAAVGADDGPGILQNHQILADSGAGGVEVLRQLFDRAFALRLQVLENGCLALTWFHRRCILRLSFEVIISQDINFHNEIMHVSD